MKLLEDDSHCYVIYDSSRCEKRNENVRCYSLSGQYVWTIESGGIPFETTFWEGRIRKNGILEFFNNDDLWYAVDKNTGKLTGVRFEKMGPVPETDELAWYYPIQHGPPGRWYE